VVLKDDKQATGPAKARAVREVSLNRESDLNCLNIQPGIGILKKGVRVYNTWKKCSNKVKNTVDLIFLNYR
jgi:hypothetical protein